MGDARRARNEAGHVYCDIGGRAFGRLTAVEPLERRDRKGGVIWLCRCSCGNVVEVPYDRLMYSGILSCGCRKKEHDRKLVGFLDIVDGTSINAIRSAKVRSDNTTGAKGVYLIKGRFVAKIVFQGRQYQLGVFDTFEEAAAARRNGERDLFAKASRHYALWKERAAADPEWGRRNPVRFDVARGEGGALRLSCLPDIAPEGIAHEHHL